MGIANKSKQVGKFTKTESARVDVWLKDVDGNTVIANTHSPLDIWRQIFLGCKGMSKPQDVLTHP
jgi:hypothetical protein